MNIKRWDGNVKINIIMRGDNIMNHVVEYKPGDVLLSLQKGIKEIKAYKDGTHKLKSLEESEKLWEKWADEDE